MLVKQYKIPMYDVRKIMNAKKRLGLSESEPLLDKYADQYFTNWLVIGEPEQHIPESEQFYDLVWKKDNSLESHSRTESDLKEVVASK